MEKGKEMEKGEKIERCKNIEREETKREINAEKEK